MAMAMRAVIIMWQKVTGRIVRNGWVYSTQGFAPGQSDVADILAIEPNASIAYEGRRIMVYERGEFSRADQIFSVHRLPWMTDSDLALFFTMRNTPQPFSIKDVCMRHEMSLGMTSTSDDEAMKKWGPTLYNKFQKNGLIEKCEKGKWIMTKL